MAKALTAKALENIKAGPLRREIPDGLVPGLYFVVQPSGATSWAVRYRHAGAPRKLTLGPYPRLTLTDARAHARGSLETIQAGQDPAAEKAAKRRAASAPADLDLVPDVIEEFLRRHVRPNNRTAKEIERVLKNEIGKPWEKRKIDEIARKDVVKLLDKIVDRGAPYVAIRVFELLRKMMSWSVERGIITASPVTGLKAPAPTASRDRVLSDDEIRWFWAATEGFDYPFQPFLRLLLLTGQRRDEVAGMSWSEVDLDAALWTLPKERAKNNKAHEIPLSAAAVDVLRLVPNLRHKSGLVFSTTGTTQISGYSKTKARLDGFMLDAARAEIADAKIPNWRLHDLRRTAASGMARLGIAVHVVEAVLNHTSGTIRGVAAVYNRYSYADEKRQALAAWARFLESLTTDQPASNVVALSRAL